MCNYQDRLDSTSFDSKAPYKVLTNQIGLVICITQLAIMLTVLQLHTAIVLLCSIAFFTSIVGYYLIKKKQYDSGIKLSLSTSFICLSIIHYVVQESENIHIIVWYLIAVLIASFLINKRWAATLLGICLFNTILIGVISNYSINIFNIIQLEDFAVREKGFFYYTRLVIPFFVIYFLINNYISNKAKTEQKTIQLLQQKNILNKRLSSSERKYKNLVEEVDDLIYKVNHKGAIVYANQTACEKTGFNESELLSFDYLSLVKEGFKREQTRFFVNQAKNQQRVSYIEFPMVSKNGQTVWLGQKTSMFFDENGHNQGSLCIARDITEERAIKEELVRAKEKAIEATKVKAHFLSSMSHEIRTPMNAVIALTHLLLEEDPKETQQEHLQTLKFSAENLLHLINDILDFSKIEAGKVTFTETTFNLKRVLTTIQHGLGSKAREKGIQLHLRFDKHTPSMVVGDPLRLTQVLNNLVGNAIKFTHKGEVVVNVSTIFQFPDSNNIQFVIKDTGIGIPSDHLSSIFNDFSQVNNTNIRQGTGLGLAITKNILELQGSHINVFSELNKGSIFKFTLNFKKAKNPLGVLPIRPHKPNSIYPICNNLTLSNTRLLLVEDNKINQKVTINFLKKWGIDVDIAENGKIATELVQTKIYQIILMDLQMPVMDGIEATKIIRSMEGYYSTAPIIALTASAIYEVQKETNRIGFTDFIAKPFLPADLYKKINQHMVLPKATARS